MFKVCDLIQVKTWDGTCFEMAETPVCLGEGNTLEERIQTTNVEEVILSILTEGKNDVNDICDCITSIYAYRFVTKECLMDRFYGPIMEKTIWTYIGEPYTVDRIQEEFKDKGMYIDYMTEEETETNEPSYAIKLRDGLLVLPWNWNYRIQTETFESKLYDDFIQYKYLGSDEQYKEIKVAFNVWRLPFNERVLTYDVEYFLRWFGNYIDLSRIYAYRFVSRQEITKFDITGSRTILRAVVEETPWTYIGEEYSRAQLMDEAPEFVEKRESDCGKQIERAVKIKDGLFMILDEKNFSVVSKLFTD